MILFPNCKINIGLKIVERRPDNYHNIETIMVPVPWCDVLEITEAKSGSGSFRLLGSDLGGCPPEKNLVMKAVRALEATVGHALPPLDISLLKAIPDGAGLGGGSSDASFTLKGINDLLGLGFDNDTLAATAARIGADCPFFIYNRPMLARGIGEILTPVELPALCGKAIAIAKPATESVATKDAYAGVSPRPLPEGLSLDIAVQQPLQAWRASEIISNDFEAPVGTLRPVIKSYISNMYDAGAIYAAMSGSGSAVFGIFDNAILAEKALENFEGAATFASELKI